MSRITLQMAKGWAETTKFNIGELDTDLLDQIETEVLSAVASQYDTSLWVDELTTPRLVRTAIAKMYVSWTYNKAYSEDEGVSNEYANRLQANADKIVSGIVDGTLTLDDAVPINTDGAGQPAFYPDDASSAQCPTWDDPSLGPATFSMGLKF